MVSRVITSLILLLLPTFLATSASAGFIIHNAPALSPRDTPPLSAAHAPIDKAILPAQICGILGAYILTVLFWGVLLLTIGKKMRRNTEQTPRALELQPTTKQLEVTPISPMSSRSATSWFKRPFKKTSTPNSPALQSPTSPAVQSIASFDKSIVESDKERRQKEMERLYAAVMDHDAKKASLSSSSEEDISPISPDQPKQQQQQAALLPGSKKPPMLDMKSAAMPRRGSHTNPASPVSPSPLSAVQAIYPPDYHNPPPTAPLPRTTTTTTTTTNPPASPRSILTKTRRTSSSSSTTAAASTSSKKSRLGSGLRNLRISAPLKYPGEAAHDEARTPLSPRFYNPPAPPSPPSAITPTSPDADYAYQEGLDKVQPLPRPAPQRAGSSYSNAPAVGGAGAGAGAGAGGVVGGATGGGAGGVGGAVGQSKSAASSTNTLPLRAMNDSVSSLPVSTKTTYVDRRLDKLSLQSPRTAGAVPATPYSPYMPFTPITPVTPHLVGKKERKEMKKYGGRRVATVEDAVQSPKEIFGDAW